MYSRKCYLIFILQTTDELTMSNFSSASYGLLSGAVRSILFPRVPNLPMVRALGEVFGNKVFYDVKLKDRL